MAIMVIFFALCLPFLIVHHVHQQKSHTYQLIALPNQPKLTYTRTLHKKPYWKIIKLKPGDSMAVVFSRLHIPAKTLYQIVHNTKDGYRLTNLRAGQEVQLRLHQHNIIKLQLPIDNTAYISIARKGDGYESILHKRKMHAQDKYLTAFVSGTLYTTSKKYGIPYSLIQQMNEIFKTQINFKRDIRQGDYFTVLYKAYYIENKLVTSGDIEAVSLHTHGKVYQAIHYEDKHGNSEYFTPEGSSLKKAFTRYPIKFSHISSTFSNSRYHPLLHYARPHRGVDLAAPIGTPIHATGNGRISMIGRQNGYGNMVTIQHDSTYSTLYGHMLKFQKGLSRGSYVKRGDIIGYVGQSGLASGPHCHYEVHVHNQPRNPTTIDLPRDISIVGAEKNRFKQTTSPIMAHLKLFEEAKLAALQPPRHAKVVAKKIQKVTQHKKIQKKKHR